MFAWSPSMNYVYIVVGSKLGTVMLKLACEGPFYRTWSRSKVYCTLCASMTPNLWVPQILGTSFVTIHSDGTKHRTRAIPESKTFIQKQICRKPENQLSKPNMWQENSQQARVGIYQSNQVQKGTGKSQSLTKGVLYNCHNYLAYHTSATE